MTKAQKFHDLFFRLGALCQEADSLTQRRTIDCQKCAGKTVTWCDSNGGAQWSYIQDKFPEEGDPAHAPDWKYNKEEIPVFGGCAESYTEAIDPGQVVGQCNTFLLLHSGWRPASSEFNDLIELSGQVEEHYEWVKKIFDDLIKPGEELHVGGPSLDLDWPDEIYAFSEDESDMESFSTSGDLYLKRFTNGTIVLENKDFFVDLDSVDFDYVIPR